MISRRGLFKMLAAVAASPVLKPFTKMMPETYTTYLVGTDAIVSHNVRYTEGRIFICGSGEMGTLWWSKDWRRDVQQD